MADSSSDGYEVYVGADISLRSVSLSFIAPTLAKLESLEIEQELKSFARLHKTLSTHSSPSRVLVVMESTSTYWMPLAHYLHEQGYIVSVVNPLTAKHYFRADLNRDKNDKLDAFNLAELAALLHTKLPVWEPPPPIYEELRQRLAQRDALTSMKVMQKHHRHASLTRPVAIASVDERRANLIRYLNSEIRAVDKEISATLLDGSEWGASARRLMSITGIGLIAASWILVATINFTTCDTPDQAASYAGLVPRQRQSGDYEGKRHIGHAGHHRLRHILYLSTIAALHYNPLIKRYYDRLVARGKPGKVAVIACERKLLHLAWVCVKKERMFDKEYDLKRGKKINSDQ